MSDELMSSDVTLYATPPRHPHKMAVLLDTVAHLVDAEPDLTFAEDDVVTAAVLLREMIDVRLGETYRQLTAELEADSS